MQYLAIDLGDKRTGLALGDSITGVAAPSGVVETPLDLAGGERLLTDLARHIERLLGRQGELVVGLPLNMDGTEGPRATLTRAFAERLAAATGRRVHLFDERLTTEAAHGQMAKSGLTHAQKKARRDAIAAAAILRGFLASRAQSGDAGK